MSKTTARRLIFVAAGLVLLLLPLFVRTVIFGYNRRTYTPADLPPLSVAATPGPTAIPLLEPASLSNVSHELRPGQVIVDLAHGNRVSRSQFEPLAAELANHGVGMRFWMGDIDPMKVSSFLDYPDQSDELESLLRGASGLVVVSPFFMWSKDEIAQVEQFVADGGRLLMISDPDVVGDLAQDINNLGEPFGIVFADDYLYDTVENDGNYVYVFQSEFVDEAEPLSDSRIALYGTRSIAGDITPQILTSDTTLSNLRVGVTGLSTVVKGGLASRGTTDGVLAMGDFDVLTVPFIERHDNARLNEYVAEFLATGERTKSVTDFPAYLGKEVSLVLASGAAVDSKTLQESAKLQLMLEESGRVLSVGGTGLLTSTLADAGAYYVSESEPDLIVLVDYMTADTELTLLSDLGFALVEITPTPEATVAAEDGNSIEAEGIGTAVATATSTATAFTAPDDAPDEAEDSIEAATLIATTAPSNSRGGRFAYRDTQNQVEETPTVAQATAADTPTETATPAPTATSTASPVPSPTKTPAPEIYLDTDDGLRLVAADTVLISQQEMADKRRVVAVMGLDYEGIRSGIDRLLNANFRGCVTNVELAVCTVPNGGSATETSSSSTGTDKQAVESDLSEENATPTPDAPSEKYVMVVDDDDNMLPGESSEADIYLKSLTLQGYGPTLWTTASDGVPALADLTGYDWVIWSSGGYESGGPGLADLDGLLAYINIGGSLTISSRRPFFGMSGNEPSVIADVAVEDDLPAMVQGLPSTAISLDNGLPPLTPLEISEDHAGAKIVLVRGSDSGDAGAPLLFVVNDDKGEDATGARLMVAGVPLTWLPNDYSKQLVRNMTGYMLEDQD